MTTSQSEGYDEFVREGRSLFVVRCRHNWARAWYWLLWELGKHPKPSECFVCRRRNGKA